MIISVDANHIKNGKKLALTCCPIALAIREQTGYYPNVTAEEVNTVFYRFTLTRSAKSFIQAFDKGKFVKPFRFKLQLMGNYHAD